MGITERRRKMLALVFVDTLQIIYYSEKQKSSKGGKYFDVQVYSIDNQCAYYLTPNLRTLSQKQLFLAVN